MQSDETSIFEGLDSSKSLLKEKNSFHFGDSSPSSSLEATIDQSSEQNHSQSQSFSQFGIMNKNIHQNNESCGREEGRDAYVRSGTHLKRLLDNALRKMAVEVSNDGNVELALIVDGDHDNIDYDCDDGQGGHGEEIGQKRQRKRDCVDERNIGSNRPTKKRSKPHDKGGDDDDDVNLSHAHTHASQLAREKFAEVMSLKRVRITEFNQSIGNHVKRFQASDQGSNVNSPIVFQLCFSILQS